MAHIIQRRQMTPWLQPEWLFRLFPEGAEHETCLSILHEFTDRVFREFKGRDREILTR